MYISSSSLFAEDYQYRRPLIDDILTPLFDGQGVKMLSAVIC